MPTLYVENVPEDLYQAIREKAKERRISMAALILSILRERLPTKLDLRRRRAAVDKLLRLRSTEPLSPGPFPSTEEMVREDRER